MEISKRLSKLEESPTLKITAKAKELKAQGKDILSFGAGEPDFDTPDNIKKAAIDAINRGETKYTAVSGINELKDAIIEKFKRDNNITYSREEITVNCGGKHSFYNLCQALLNEGDEVILQAPYWVSYTEIIKLAGGVPVLINTNKKTNFKFSALDLKASITDKTKALLLNSPSNPTGMMYTEAEIKEIAQVCLDNNILLISDEIYETLTYGEVNHLCPASISEEVKANSFILNGVSKSYSMTGWRIGYTAGNKEIIKAMNKLQSQSTSNPCTISQWASVEAISGPQDIVKVMNEAFKKRRDLIVEGLNSIDGIECVKPNGAFYVFPSLEGIIGKSYKDFKINSSLDFSDFLLSEALVAVVPGIAFGMENYLRMSYACSDKHILEGIKRIKEAVSKLS